MKRYRVVALMVVAVLATVLVGTAAEKLMVDGSTGVMPLVAALAKAYQARNPEAMVELGKGLGTKARIEALAEGKIDIALASHGLNVEEVSRQAMTVLEIAKVAVVFGVNATVPVEISPSGRSVTSMPAPSQTGGSWAARISRLRRGRGRIRRSTPKS